MSCRHGPQMCSRNAWVTVSPVFGRAAWVLILFRGEDTVTHDGVSRELSVGKNCNILCVGREQELLSLRAMVLRGAGFRVDEECDLTRALQVALEGSIDLVLLCHTWNSSEQSRIIHSLRAARPHMPVACVITLDHQGAPAGSVAVPSDPQRLIEAIRQLFQKNGGGYDRHR